MAARLSRIATHFPPPYPLLVRESVTRPSRRKNEQPEAFMTPRRMCLLPLLAAIILAGPAATARAQALSDDEAFKIGTETYVYGYPLVTMEITRRVMTNVVAPHGTHAPMGQFLL